MPNSFSPKSKNNVWKKFKVPSESISEKDSPGGIGILNFKSIIRNVLISKELPFIIILAVMGVSNIKCIIRDLMKLKKLSLIIISFMGIYILHNYIIGQDHNSEKNPKHIMVYMYSLYNIKKDQDTDKNRKHENKLENSERSNEVEIGSNFEKTATKDEIDSKPTSDDNNNNDNDEELRYDPSKNYEELAWEAFYSLNKADPIIKKVKDIIKLHNELSLKEL
ncbi:hypothetical protein RclHR1_16980002 [Rhizophagus clarus]|uniref:Uncharacterized protein n=1 Tax=Rhizophagus clarus TaxID=94130 RepID=A0A2Z6QJ04_9GLOM|nr:hypothetical protein RclHR1_16980002 [Rhizophagus clarus]GES76574.1 hypothetical protein GLOIN_2v1789072 [Rhizophagus clarus]